MVPERMKAVSASLRVRKRDMSPMDKRPTTGQNASSKRKKTLRDAMRRLRRAKAQTATASARQFNEHLLQLGLSHLEIAHHGPLLVEHPQEFREALLRRVHRALEPSVALHAPQHAGQLPQDGEVKRIEAQ